MTVRFSLDTRRRPGGKVEGGREGCWDLLCDFPISIPSGRDVTSSFFRVFHDASLIHHVPMSIRHQLFQVIRHQFPSDVDPFHRRTDDAPPQDWYDVGRAESGVDDQTTLGRVYSRVPRSPRVQAVRDRRRSRNSQVVVEIVLFEHDLVVMVLNVGKVVNRFRDRY
jgi:hypothetical protein